jgi:hypothetical protein
MLTCGAAAGVCGVFWTFIHDLKSVQALHGFFFGSPVCSGSLPVLFSGGLPVMMGNPWMPAVDDPPVDAAMSAVLPWEGSVIGPEPAAEGRFRYNAL